MRHSLAPKFKKYVQGFDFLSFARKCEDKYGKKLMDTAEEKRNRCCKGCF